MRRENQLHEYAEYILECFGHEILKYSYDDYIYEIEEKINEGEIPVKIPYVERELSFDYAKELALKESPDDILLKLDGFSSGLSEILYNSDTVSNMLQESLATNKARKLGLIHKGFGNYAEEKDGATMFKTVDGKLVPFGSKKKKKSDSDSKDKKSNVPTKKEEPNSNKDSNKKDDKEVKKDKKQKKTGITGIRRSKSNKYTYHFEQDGVASSITLSDKEYSSGVPVINIIKTKIEHRKKMKNVGEKSKEFKKQERRSRESKFGDKVKKRKFKTTPDEKEEKQNPKKSDEKKSDEKK